MSRYISIDKVLGELGLNHNDYVYVDKNEVAERIRKIPSIDIVRCRECKHREEYPCKVYHDDDWFCADGER